MHQATYTLQSKLRVIKCDTAVSTVVHCCKKCFDLISFTLFMPWLYSELSAQLYFSSEFLDDSTPIVQSAAALDKYWPSVQCAAPVLSAAAACVDFQADSER